MPFTGSGVNDLVHLFDGRQASLFHACQLRDFRSYLQLGGIPSRQHLQENLAGFTAFDTDDIDRDNNVWDKVFLNLTDFGTIFAYGRCGVPNPYGPIVFQINPLALKETSDVAICLRSAGAKGFDRDREALTTITAVDGLFRGGARAGFPTSAEVKFGDELRQFYPYATNPEISCTVSSGLLSLRHTIIVIVDPYSFGGRSLLGCVEDECRFRDMEIVVRERPMCPSRRCMMGEMQRILSSCRQLASIDDALSVSNISASLSEWLQELKERDLDYQFRRFIDYLQDGTINTMLASILPRTPPL